MSGFKINSSNVDGTQGKKKLNIVPDVSAFANYHVKNIQNYLNGSMPLPNVNSGTNASYHG